MTIRMPRSGTPAPQSCPQGAACYRDSPAGVTRGNQPTIVQSLDGSACGSDAIDVLVTDRDASDAHVGPLREAGVEVLLA